MTDTTLLTKIKPLGDRVIGKKLEEKEQQKGGIILPDSAKKEQQLVEILAVGPGKEDKDGNLSKMPVQVGDIVLIEKYASQEVSLDDQDYIVAKASEIVAIVDSACCSEKTECCRN